MSLPTYAASESNELKNVTLSLYSNLSPERYISGLYRDNTFYITLEDLCALTRGKIIKETEEEAVVSFGNCRNGKSIREFVIDVGSGNMSETLYSDKYNITLPSLTQDGKVYVSALHFLRYLGATVKLQEDSPVQFMVIKRYDIFDALSDLINSDLGNFFWWDEVDTGEEDLEDKLTNAGIIALIDRDSNIFRMMFDAKGIEQEALEDALLSIVKNEGQGYFTENSAESELIDTASSIIGAEADWFDLIKEAYADGSDVLSDQISDLASSAAITAGFANNVIGVFESLKQFDNMSRSQRNLLEKTVLQYPEDSKTLCDGWDVVFDAAKNVSGKIQSEYDAQYKAALDVAESTAYDFLNGATGAAGANPVAIAWNGVTLLTKMIPFTNEMIEKKEQLYNSYNCSIIQLIANEMLVEAYSDWYYGNALYTGSAEQYKKLDAVKQLIVLQLKSTLTTREYLINSGFLESNYASEMKEMNQETAILLNKVENCQINGVDLFSAEYEDDISWIANCEKTISIDLLDGYWENNIQSHKVYQFLEDGTVNEYDAEPGTNVVPENLFYSRTLHYQWDGKTLVIDWGGGFKTTLEQVTNASPVEWDMGLSTQISRIPDGEEFFYETEWEYSGAPSDNAMYLVKADTSEKVQNSDALHENDILTVAGTLTEEYYEINSQNKGTVYILKLDTPIKKSLYSDWLGYSGESVEIDEIQISFLYHDDYIRSNLLGKQIEVTGSVMYAHTGHHLTTILLMDAMESN